MSVSRDCAQDLLGKLAAAGDGTKGKQMSYDVGATMAVAYALLDVADAIREQTHDLTTPIEMPEFER